MSTFDGHAAAVHRPPHAARTPALSLAGGLLGRVLSLPRRALVAAAVLSLALAGTLYVDLHGGHASPPWAAHAHGSQNGLLSLPLSARGPVSEALGADSAAYRIRPSAGGFQAASPAQHLSASFSSAGVSVSAGATRVGLRLLGVGYGSTLIPLGPGSPKANANRVLYSHSGLSEWYVNGPLGLEQGFTIARAPAGIASAPLTLSIALSGNARASLDRGDQSVTLTHAGISALRYTGLSVTDARGHALHSWLSLQGGRLELRIDSAGAPYPLRIDPFVQQGGKLTGSGESGKGDFGESVALSSDGNTALIGGPFDNSGVGAAWVFVRSGSTWSQQGGKLTGSEASGLSEFGRSVALSSDGNTALIGGPFDNNAVGAAWVFTRSGSTWTQQGLKLTGEEEVEQGFFGRSVALSADGNTALIGGPGDNTVGATTGAIWVFTRSDSTWTQQGKKLRGSGEVGKGSFGESLALSSDGNTALIGAGADSNNVGAAWVFVRSGSTWSQQGKKLVGGKASGPVVEFGHSVALSADGNTALIGGPHDTKNEVGAAWVFNRSGSTWTQQGEKFTGSGEVGGGGEFGSSVALSADGNSALIGGPGDNGVAGAAWVFTRSGEVWTQQGAKLTGSGEVGTGLFGASVALSSDANTALIGAWADNSSVGAAWAFEKTVETGSATEVKLTSAVLNATVNPNGVTVTECKFEYGTTTSYGSSAACSPSPGSGTSPVAVSAALSGLAESTTYHFRVSATNGSGTLVGNDRTFTTLVTSASGSTKEETKPAEATDGKLSTKASAGTGTITIGQYGANPGGPRLLGSSGKYIDDYRSPASTFQKIEFSDCELNGAKSLAWWNPRADAGEGEWREVSRQTYIPGSTPCIKVEIEASTRPTVSEMTGTRFGTRFGTKNVPTPPEFGRCVAGPISKEGKPEGLLKESTCLALSEGSSGLPEGKYEWELEVLTKALFTTKLTSGSVTLESALASSKVTCKGESSGGEYTGAQTVAGIVLTLTGCAKGTEKCASAGRSPGEVASKTLEGTLGVEKKGTTTAKNKVALELFPAGKTGPFAEFSCAGTSVSVRGAVIVPVKANAMSLTQAMKFVATKGKQKPELFEGGPKAILEESFNGGAYEQTGLSAAITQTNKEKVEINSVL